VNNLSNRVPDFSGSESEGSNLLLQYVQSMNPETVAQLSKPSSNEVFQVMERTSAEVLGNLPTQHFAVNITMSREYLGRLLAAAMINGYFLGNVEQRMALEKSFQAAAEANSTSS